MIDEVIQQILIAEAKAEQIVANATKQSEEIASTAAASIEEMYQKASEQLKKEAINIVKEAEQDSIKSDNEESERTNQEVLRFISKARKNVKPATEFVVKTFLQSI